MKFKKGDKVKVKSNIKTDGFWCDVGNIPRRCYEQGVVIDSRFNDYLQNEKVRVKFYPNATYNFEATNIISCKKKVG